MAGPDLSNLPLILAGPILRRTEPTQVTVWIALKESRDVTLRIFDPLDTTVPKAALLIGTRRTVALGAHLHLVAVTARLPIPPPASGSLSDGIEYTYNLAFGTRDANGHVPETEKTLLSDEILWFQTELDAAKTEEERRFLRLSYTSPDDLRPGDPFQTGGLPSFTMAPPEVADLRVIHASCRKPHGEGVDQLAKLDELIDPARRGQAPRPHLLFLTGDQIYADDVADQLLYLIMDGSDALLVGDRDHPRVHSWPGVEQICLERDENPEEGCKDGKPIDKSTEEFKVGKREAVMEDHGFTAGDVARSHLIALGEFYLMYLMAWSDRLWPVSPPEFEDALGEPKEVDDPMSDGDTMENPLYTRWKEQEVHLKSFREALPAVRRTLANIPCYMMLDDHEITDDLYLHLKWCVDVLGNPFGKRVIQNGMAAFALFQAWGNTPDRFDPTVGSESDPGPSFLAAIEKWRGELDDEHEQAIAKHLGIFHRGGPHPSDSTKPGLRLGDLICQRGLDHPTNMGVLDWHYQVDGPGFQVLALDTRTWRYFSPDSSNRGACSPDKADSFESNDLEKMEMELEEPPVLISERGRKAQIPMSPASGVKDYLFVISPCPVFEVGWFGCVKWLGRWLLWEGAFGVGGSQGADYEDWALQPQERIKLLGDLASYVESLENPSGKDILTVFLTGDVHFGYCERIQLMQEIPRIPQRFLNLTASALKNEAGKTRFAQYVGVEFGWDGDPNPGNEEDKDENVIVKFDFVLDKGCVDKDDPRCLSPADCGPSTNSTVPPDALAANECAGRMHQKIAEGDSGREIVGHNNIAEIRFTPETGEGDARSVTQILYWNDEVEKETHYRVSLGPWA